MTPYERVLRIYRNHPEMSLGPDLEAHMRLGFLVCTPQMFAMCRPVRREWSEEWLSDLDRVEPLETADCWYFWLLTGDLATTCQWLPYHLPWFAFSRRRKPIKFMDAARLLPKVLAKRKRSDALLASPGMTTVE